MSKETFDKLKAEVTELIANNKLEKAIIVLSNYFNNTFEVHEIILQSARYSALKKDQMSGLIDASTANTELNKLRLCVLTFLQEKEESLAFKKEIFSSNTKEDSNDLIPVFLSVGTPHNQFQTNYIHTLKNHFLKYKLDLKTLDDDDWTELDPLRPVSVKMASCYGCLVLAMERTYIKNGLSKRASKQESVIEDQCFATPWVHIEASMAYQLKLPFIILKENQLKSEGMLDVNLFEGRIVKINTSNPSELKEYPIKSFTRKWVEDVHNNFQTN
ncbi:hypothetical protein KO494_03145 [Lacinutrix sp. C3R15]|uniref:hypothetical protein n=1 Tax=Flavobacteriaceae TaxID=49546 RepID=UPI001C090DF7|nr:MULTISPECIES: hypothetical protein [Flavobacteriaceae]MBU2938527.1 hypothetical protein [Lacinutrix sp. C3R15]MDO6621841.1 hypothetical protein [Oceanihabitans sp. 1_MG-2023]